MWLVLVMPEMFAVGMHHYKHRSLSINQRLKISREPNNPYDKFACSCIDESGEKLAYLDRSSARSISSIIDTNIPNGPVYIKAKFEPNVKNKRKGPQQKCSVAIKISENQKEHVEQFLKLRGIPFYYHKK